MPLRGPGARPKLRGVEPSQPTTVSKTWQAPRLTRAQRIVRFIESLPVTKGHLAGTRMKLLPAQKRFIRAVYGGSGVRLAVLSAPRGNGKTGLLAGLTLAHLCGPEAIERGECFSAAIDRSQAAILFNEMRAIIEAVPAFEARCNVIKHFKKIEVTAGPGAGSTYEALSNDARRGHGLAPSFWCFDELGQVKDRELLDALTTAMGKQPGALGITISTQSADDEHPLSQLIDDGLVGLDPSVYVQLHAAPEDADPLSPKTWAACNFALGKFLDRKDMQAQAARAARVPAFMSAFRNLRLNQRVHADERLISRDDWLACAGEVDVAALAGRRCWAGLDLSSTTDLTALVLAFEGDPMPILAWHWMPAGRIDELSHEDHQTYRVWRDQGLIETTAGRAIDKTAVAFRLAEIASQYEVQAIGYDDWRFADLAKLLSDEGIVLPLKPMRQGFKTMAGCVDALERAVLDRKIVHGNQVLTMCISNATVETDPTGSRKLSKKRSRSRIDSAVCLAMALGLKATEPGAKVYDFSQMMVLTA